MSATPAVEGVRLRWARVDDAEAGARLHLDCWREVYGPITDPAMLAAHLDDEAGWAARWRDQLEGGATRLLAVGDDGTLLGFAAAGPARRDDAPADTELYALYVREAWHGTGIGAALFERTVGDAPACLWVLEDNARARAFYARRGFRSDGTRKKYDPLDAWELRLVRP